eukprot:446924_1
MAEEKKCAANPSNDDVITEFIEVMDHVYGAYPNNNAKWKPKGYKKTQPRYLWTDAFGVVNYLTLYVYTKNEQYLNQALILVDEVHNTLGKTRDYKKRLGNSTTDHPILNGLRIGKIGDESETMDGDGQYFHYNTKWLFALNRVSLITGDLKYNKWAIEMAKNIFPKFVDYKTNKKRPRMYWKLNINLDKILVNSEGNLDPLDGYITYKLLQELNNDKSDNIIDLTEEISIFKQMIDRKVPYYDSSDTLDLGEACWISHWYLNEEQWAKRIALKSLENLNQLNLKGQFDQPSYYRLAFREFGTTLGTQCLYYNSDKIQIIKSLSEPFHDKIVPKLLTFWKRKNIYQRDNDITPMMYCSSILPGVWNKNFKQFIKK